MSKHRPRPGRHRNDYTHPAGLARVLVAEYEAAFARAKAADKALTEEKERLAAKERRENFEYATTLVGLPAILGDTLGAAA